jgi:hypothetical protein
MRTSLFVLATLFTITGCTTHKRISGGTTYNTDSGTFGGEGSLTGASGDEGFMLVASASARAGHHLNGGSLLFGGETSQLGSQVGFRLTGAIGPAFIGRDDEIDVSAEVRGGFAVFKLFDTSTSRLETYAKHTVGLEMFVSNVGFDSSGTMLGLALTVGRISKDSPHFGAGNASRERRRIRHHLARR